MSRIFAIVIFLVLGLAGEKVHAQVGIGTTTANSTLTVNGSFAATYKSVTATAYTMTATDFFVEFNGTAACTITLPAGASGSSSYSGRVYYIRNNTPYTLTVQASGSEKIDDNSSLSLSNNSSVMLISTGAAAGGTTWELVNFGTSSSSGSSSSGGSSGTVIQNPASIVPNIYATVSVPFTGTYTSTTTTSAATMTTALNSLPNGGYIKLVPSSYSITSGNSSGWNTGPSTYPWVIAMPAVTGYIGKSFIIYLDFSSSKPFTGSSSYYGYVTLAMSSTSGVYAFLGSASNATYPSVSAINSSSPGVYIYTDTRANTSPYRISSAPMFHVYATADGWFVNGVSPIGVQF